ncbi:bifunctional protein FolD [Glutamicibacter uratoxydans]|uniref:Bifunctional protein FolD n=1 Tax=Glutamicibacter uratoxydans TaxID=43667 RepID=A0A4Y4DUS8_GLUUR|nr:bifunctional 5,10-methylenetetrahydrofolate dehydrogenase/5,10-methenyltetrahydrofolate cyclohydrolase [Glutamicibacter uratoxydans]GED06171.1 bifunctional protein FolD [Glutamicibacter uratoxydans]
MSARLLTGLPVAKKLRADTARNIKELAGTGVVPKLAVVLATDNESTAWYVRSIVRQAAEAAVHCDVVDLGADAGQWQLQEALEALALDHTVHGIILQTPLPAGVDAAVLAALIPVHKDIDGANPESLGRLAAGLPAYAATTAQAAVEVLEHYQVPLAGEHVTVIGRSMVVGKPLAQLLLARDATVTTCHSRTRDLASHTKASSVVVVAAGRAGLLTGADLNEDSVVVDVGTNVDEAGRLIGDVHADSVLPVAKALSPVPGGVGTVTTSLLMLRTSQAALESLVASAQPA